MPTGCVMSHIAETGSARGTHLISGSTNCLASNCILYSTRDNVLILQMCAWSVDRKPPQKSNALDKEEADKPIYHLVSFQGMSLQRLNATIPVVTEQHVPSGIIFRIVHLFVALLRRRCLHNGRHALGWYSPYSREGERLRIEDDSSRGSLWPSERCALLQQAHALASRVRDVHIIVGGSLLQQAQGRDLIAGFYVLPQAVLCLDRHVREERAQTVVERTDLLYEQAELRLIKDSPMRALSQI